MTTPRSVYSLVLFVLTLGLAVPAQAIPIIKLEPNNTPATAQNIDAFFSLDFSPDIGDVTGANTSTTIPHVTVNAFGANAAAGGFDWYSFIVPSAGSVGIFDIDYGVDTVCVFPTCFDSNLQLLNSAFAEIAINDDFGFQAAGAGGSLAPGGFLDSFIQFTFAAPGTYYIGVGDCCVMAPMTNGADYALQVSVQNHAVSGVVPEPATLALLGTGIAGLAARRLRRRRN
jgi:PEP-CTERM motif